MRFRIPILLALVGLAAVLSIGGEKGSSPPAPALGAEDAVDIVYFAPDRPLLIRFFLQKDGQSLRAAWDDFFAALFKFLDRDGDGFLSKDEAALVPGVQDLLNIARGTANAPPAKIDFALLDTDGDGKVSLEKFTTFYRRSGITSTTISGIKGLGDQPDAVSNTLFKALDKNGDGVLTKDEVDDAFRVLSKFDFNDDELISIAELLGSENIAAPDPRVTPPELMEEPQLQQGRFFLFGRDDSPRKMNQRMQLAKELIRRYDTNSDGKLSREEFDIDPQLFKALDRNRDGFLDELELLQYTRRSADLQMIVRLGKKEPKETTLALYPTRKEAGPLAASSRAVSDFVMQANWERHRFDLVVHETSGQTGYEGIRDFYIQALRNADVKQKGFVTKEDLRNNPQAVLLNAVFDIADRDGDGKLTEKELTAFLDLLAKADAAAIDVKVGELGRGMFNLLDINRDGALSPYELKTAWSVLMPDDPDGKRSFVLTSIPEQMQIQVNVGLNAAQQERFVSIRRSTEATTGPDALQVPKWFYKMDRNGDGFVSYREFLGSREEFEKIDRNHDGLISPEEAAAYDAQRRKK